MVISVPSPQRPPNFVFDLVRTRLMRRLAEDFHRRPKLLSVVAPIGYGKTVLMSALFETLSEAGERCLWLGLDERHTTVEHFLSCLSDSQDSLDHSVMDLVRGGASLDRQLDSVLDHLATLPPTTLFIDNLNSCTDERLGKVLDGMIFRTAGSLRLVWSSTVEPGCNIGRARLEGLVQQVSSRELGLEAADVAAMLGPDLCAQIGDDSIHAIVRRTEGWPAAIRLAQIVLAESEQPLEALAAFSGTDEDVVLLLKRQVMGRFTLDLQYFLLRLALLRNFSQDLCSQAIDTRSAHEYLNFLLSRNVFMIPLDRNRQRYRLHNMFREFLLTEARRSLSENEQTAVYERAAQWCEAQGEWHDAVEYSLAAKALDHGRTLLDKLADHYVREQHNVQQFVSWVNQFESLGGSLGLKANFWYVWALVFLRQLQAGRQELERLAATLSHTENSTEKDNLILRVMHLRLCLELFVDHLADGERVINRWLDYGDDRDAYAAGSVRCAQSICLTARFEFARSRQVMLVAQTYWAEVGGPYSKGWISLIEGVTCAVEGAVGSGYRELTTGLSRAKQELGGDAQICCALASVASYCATEMAEFVDARRLLEVVLPNFQSNVLVDHAAFGLEAAINLWEGDGPGLAAIEKLRERVRGYPPRLSLMFSCFLIRRMLMLGDLERAEAEARQINLAGDLSSQRAAGAALQKHPGFESIWLAARLQLMIARRQFRSASLLAAQQIAVLKAEGRHARLLELELASATISLQLGKVDPAAKLLTGAVRRAAQRRLLRGFMDHRDTVESLVGSGCISSRSFALRDESQFFEELCGRLGLGEIDEARAHALPGNEIGAPTQREAELLTLLETGLSNAEIASYTNLSITTVKWHLKNLYKKLDVGNRAAAIATARKLGLLSR